MTEAKPAHILRTRIADASHAVHAIKGGDGAYQKRPCKDCPWRKDAVGIFPANAFRLSAETAEDVSWVRFGCHAAGTGQPKTCAGFILRGADHNLAVRLGRAKGRYVDVKDGGHELFADYVEMAIANGVPENDPALAKCRRVGPVKPSVGEAYDEPE